MKILFYGAGVLGSLFAARMHAAGHHVTLLARGQRLEDLRQHGVVLEDARTGVRTTAQIPVIDELKPDDAYDLIAVIMRKNQVADILPALAANSTPNVLFLGNNVAGPEAYVRALGQDRVLMGFAGAAGRRDGHVIRYATSASGPSLTLGELHGQNTARLQQITAAFMHGGINVTICPNIDAWLKTHWAVVGPLAGAVYAANGDAYRLSRTRDGLVLIVRAIREGFRVLRSRGIPITPGYLRVIAFIPETILILVLKRLAATELATLAVASHANAARDEMQALEKEFRAIKRRTQVWTPSLDRLMLYMDPNMPVMVEGCAVTPLSWQGTLALAAGVLLVWNVILRLRHRD